MPTSPPIFNTTRGVTVTAAALALVHLATWLPLDWLHGLADLFAFAPSRFLAVMQAVLFTDAEVTFWPLVALSPLSHALLHADIFHLAVNLAFLLAFGTPVERRLGMGRFLLLAVLSALAGALAVTLTYLVGGQGVLVVGASGAVSGLFGAVIRLNVRRRLLVLVVFIAINLFLALTGITLASGGQGIAWDAHIGGLLAGYLLAPWFDRRRAPA